MTSEQELKTCGDCRRSKPETEGRSSVLSGKLLRCSATKSRSAEGLGMFVWEHNTPPENCPGFESSD